MMARLHILLVVCLMAFGLGRADEESGASTCHGEHDVCNPDPKEVDRSQDTARERTEDAPRHQAEETEMYTEDLPGHHSQHHANSLPPLTRKVRALLDVLATKDGVDEALEQGGLTRRTFYETLMEMHPYSQLDLIKEFFKQLGSEMPKDNELGDLDMSDFYDIVYNAPYDIFMPESQVKALKAVITASNTRGKTCLEGGLNIAGDPGFVDPLAGQTDDFYAHDYADLTADGQYREFDPDTAYEEYANTANNVLGDWLGRTPDKEEIERYLKVANMYNNMPIMPQMPADLNVVDDRMYFEDSEDDDDEIEQMRRKRRNPQQEEQEAYQQQILLKQQQEKEEEERLRKQREEEARVINEQKEAIARLEQELVEQRIRWDAFMQKSNPGGVCLPYPAHSICGWNIMFAGMWVMVSLALIMASRSNATRKEPTPVHHQDTGRAEAGVEPTENDQSEMSQKDTKSEDRELSHTSEPLADEIPGKAIRQRITRASRLAAAAN